MNMKLLITSGGTSEAIIKSAITNHASGHLGKLIAEKALDWGHDEVTLVTTKQAVKPAPHEQLTIVQITNVESLKATLGTFGQYTPGSHP